MDEVVVSSQVRQAVNRALKALNPEQGFPQFEIDITHTVSRSWATGMAAAHIGEFPARPTITLHARVEPRVARLLVGTFDSLLLNLTVEKTASTSLIETAIERLGGEFKTVVSVRSRDA